MAGIAGALLANQAEFVVAAYMSWQRSGDLIIMVVLGGMGTLSAPSRARPPSSCWRNGWRPSPALEADLGVILILVVLFTRGGIVGFFERVFRRGRHG
jgi:branched-chain amino acid transport system permease protein